MSGSCVASIEALLTSSALTRFKSIWHVDFEFRQDAYRHPLPVCMFTKEQYSGREIFLRRDQLLTLRRAPFDTGPNDLMVTYTNAELSCFQILGWPFPYNVLDVYVETCAAINGLEIEGLKDKRPSLLETLELFGLPSDYTGAEKTSMRDLILDHQDYSEEQWREIENYNRADVDDTLRILPPLLPNLDLTRALHRGQFMTAITPQELLGLPIDTDAFNRLLENWDYLRLHYITRDDEFGLYDGTSFVEQRLGGLIKNRRWDWALTPSGKYKADAMTFGKQARRYPELKRTAHMRQIIGELRLNDIASAVGVDGFCRCWLAPFWTRTGRNQPPGKVFLPALPTWLRGLLRPPPGWVLIELDWKSQEVAIMAGITGDPAMIEDYKSGDPYWGFGLRAGLVACDADKAEHRELRDKVLKPVVLGQNYGMSPYGIAAKTGHSLRWARGIHAQHRHTYPTFHRYLGDAVTQAKFDRKIYSVLGWPMAVTGDTKHRTLMNFIAQAAAADAMRLAGIAARDAGIRICCSVHDSFWILAPEGDEGRTIAKMVDIMREAGAAVSGGLPIEVEVKAVIPATHNLGDLRKPGDKGYEMWAEVHELLEGGLLRRAGGG